MKMMNDREEANSVNRSGTTSEAAAPGRCSVNGQALPGRHPAIAPSNVKSRRRWGKEDYKVLVECYLKAEMEGARGIGRRMLSLWNDKNMFEMSEINLK